MVLWIFRRDFPHGVAIGDQARSLRRTLEVTVQLADSRQIRPFAFSLYAHRLAMFHVLPSCLQLALVFHSLCERITPIAQRDSPICDSARRVLPQHRVNSFYCASELEGVQQRYRPVELLLCPRVA